MPASRGHLQRYRSDGAGPSRPASVPRRIARCLRISAVLAGLSVIAVVVKLRRVALPAFTRAMTGARRSR
jgi:hypothetical protein